MEENFLEKSSRTRKSQNSQKSHGPFYNLMSKFEKIFLKTNTDEHGHRVRAPKISPSTQRLSLYEKKRSVIKAVLNLKKNNEWNDFKSSLQKKINQEESIKDKMRYLFNINSDFVVIWKTIFSLFNVLIVFMYFFKYFFLKLMKNDKEEPSRQEKICYYLINAMFIVEFIISLIVVVFNKGSVFTYIKLPFKLIMCIPFPLKKRYWYYILFKFLRLDLVERLFTIVETFCSSIINNFIHNYYLKIFMTYLNQLFKYLLIFGLYAHFIGSVFSYYSTTTGYLKSLYFTLETFTTIGYGDVGPETEGEALNIYATFIIIIINMFIGVNLFYIITTNIKLLYLKIYGFNRDTSFQKQFDSLLFKIQKSTGRVFPRRIKESMSSYLLFRRGLCYKDLLEKYQDVFQMCRYDVKNEIRKRLFDFLVKEYAMFFKGCSEDFMYRIFENLKPKM